MSPTKALARLRQRRPDSGFTLLEVVVAIGILAIAATASLGFIVTGYRAAATAKMDTVGRSLTQGTLEKLHNLPYHIAADVSTSPDLLDSYFPNIVGTAGRGATGYVPATATRFTADGDPATGAFFRTVSTNITGFPGYKQYVTLQFLNTDGTVVPPVAGWAAGTVGADKPASNQVAATVTTFWSTTTTPHKYTSYTEISAGRPAVPRINLQQRLTALTVSGTLPDGNTLSLVAGDIDINGSLANTSSATAKLTGIAAEIANVGRTFGAQLLAAAPPNVAAGTPVTAGGSTVYDSGVGVASWGGSSVGGASVGTTSGQPYVASSASQAFAQLTNWAGGSLAASFTDEPNNTHLGLTSTTPVLQVPNACGGCSPAMVQGYATSGSTTSSHNASAAGSMSTGGGGHDTARLAPITLFPTAAGGNGIVQIALSYANVSCSTSGNFGSTSTASSTVDYDAWLRYMTYNGSYAWSQWQELKPDTSALSSIPMNTQVDVDAAGNPVLLGDYIQSWSSLTPTSISTGTQNSTDGKSARGSYSVLSITTQPLRVGDPTSGVGISLGSLTCTAEDNR